jgi:hypothetical protein
MLEFKMISKKRKLDLPENVIGKFENPIVFYLLNKNDATKLLYTFVIFDSQNNEIEYLHTYLLENIESSKKQEDYNLIRMKVDLSNPHCILKVDDYGSFYSFVEAANFFFHIDRKKGVMKILLAKDIPGLNNFEIDGTGDTFFKDDDDKNYFYASLRGREKGSSLSELFFFRISLDLKKIELVYRTEKHYLFVPHVTKKFKNYLLNSEFDLYSYKFNRTGEIFFDEGVFEQFIKRELFKDFCLEEGIFFDEKKFQEEISRCALKKEESRFELFWKKKGGRWPDVCKNDNRLSFSIMPGIFNVVDLKNKTEKAYNTSECRVAHFEIDKKENAIYTSSHNFMRWEGIYYFGPAAIDKFVLKDGILHKCETFSDKTGFRFTSHKVFYYNGVGYLCTVGHPNRLFFAYLKNMEKFYSYDIGEDVLSGKQNLVDYLNTKNLRDKNHGAFEISAGGEFVFIVGGEKMYVHNFPKKTITWNDSYFVSDFFEAVEDPSGFVSRTTHVSYLI